MAFSFGFTADVDDEDITDTTVSPAYAHPQVESTQEPVVPVKAHSLEELVGTTTPFLSYGNYR